MSSNAATVPHPMSPLFTYSVPRIALLVALSFLAGCSGSQPTTGSEPKLPADASSPPLSSSSEDPFVITTTSFAGSAETQLSLPASSTEPEEGVQEPNQEFSPEESDNIGPEVVPLPEGKVINGIYDDPRGSLFAEFQRSFDRSERFLRLDTFCVPSETTAVPVEMAPGISAEAITVVHIATRLEELAKVGFNVSPESAATAVEEFVDIINSECEGIHGRSLDLRTIKVSALGGGGYDIDTLREASCLEAVESHQAAVVLAVTAIPGTAAGCLSIQNSTAHIATRGVSDSDLIQAGGLLQSLEPGDRTSLRLALGTALDQGLLEGATIGLVMPDAPQRSDDLLALVRTVLEESGLIAGLYQIGCDGTTTCRVGLDTAVTSMKEDGVNVLLPILDTTSLPWLVLEMLKQQIPTPLFVQSGIDGQGLDVIAAQVAEFGGAPAGSYYNGALVVDASATGSERLDGAESRPFDRMCTSTWAEATGNPIPLVEDPTNDLHRSVVEACSLVRWVARAAEAAGPNPSLQALRAALGSIGSLDVLDMRPTTIDDRHLRTVQVRRYEYPCRNGIGFGNSDGCLVPVGPPVILDRSGLAVTGLEPPRLPPADVKVFVTNGSGEGGVAGKVTGWLREAGYDAASPGNALSVDESTIYYRPGHLGDARAIREIVSPFLRVDAMPASTNFVPQRSATRTRTADVVVVIGLDLGRQIRSDN